MSKDMFANFSRSAVTRGKTYANRGRVISVTGDRTQGIQSIVANTRGTIYTQDISWTEYAEIEGFCSCPVGYNCKHVAAALMTFFDSEGTDDVPRSSAMDPRAPKRQQKPKASANDGLNAHARQWLAQMAELAAAPEPGRDPHLDPGGPRPEEYPARIRDRLVYVLEGVDGELRVSTWKAQVNAKTGELNAASRPYDVFHNLRQNVAQFIRPLDLDLLGRLLQAKLIKGGTFYQSFGYGVPNYLERPWMFDPKLIEDLCATGRCFALDPPEPAADAGERDVALFGTASQREKPNLRKPLTWSPARRAPELTWKMHASGAQRLGFSGGTIANLGETSLWIDAEKQQIGMLETQVSPAILKLVSRSPALQVETPNLASLNLPKTLGPMKVPPPQTLSVEERSVEAPKVHLALAAAKTRAGSWVWADPISLPTLTVTFDYAGYKVRHQDIGSIRFFDKDRIVHLGRDEDWEASCLQRLAAYGAVAPEQIEDLPSKKMLEADLVFDEGHEQRALRFTAEGVPALRRDGWTVTLSKQWPYRITEGTAAFSAFTTASKNEDKFQGHSWFEMGFEAEIDGQKFNIASLIAAFTQQYAARYLHDGLPDLEAFRVDIADDLAYLKLQNGTYAAVSPVPIAPILHLFLSRQIELELMHPSEASLAQHMQEALAGSDVRFADHAGILPLASALEALGKTPDAPFQPPANLCATLRPYQAFGAEWMTRLTQSGFGGVLADDMGLGKTLQTLTTLLTRTQQNPAPQTPSLLIVPTSLLSTWQTQAADFTPDLRLHIHHGSDRLRDLSNLDGTDLVISTYPLLARDRDILAAQDWDLVMLDEAQTLKNPASQMAKALRHMSAKGRLALTGTPVENSLQDLWTLYDWVVPGLLGNRKTFTSLFRTPIEKHKDADAQARLNRRLNPFLLRRTKEEVATELPPRTEIIEAVTLSKPQQALYESVRVTMDRRVQEAVASKGFTRAQITILDALLKLRQVCCDPGLVKIEAARAVTESAKRARLRDMVQEFMAAGRKVLIFSQFTSMLDLIAKDLSEMHLPYTMLTGQTKDRKGVLQQFKEGEASIFLLSLKAGGVGLTLTEADTVILYDPWWNPAAERQAMDRAHRIGQDKPVFVHRLVASGTVEEKVLALQAHKQALADAVLNADTDTSAPKFDPETLRDLFAPLE